MNQLTPQDSKFDERVRASFALQPFIQFIGARLTHVAAGEIDILLPKDPNILQQHGFVHGGVLTSIADAAAGYAALTIAAPGSGVLTTELKVNFLRPASGAETVARGRVIKPGRTLTVLRADVFSVTDDKETHVLTGLVTIMHVDGMSD